MSDQLLVDTQLTRNVLYHSGHPWTLVIFLTSEAAVGRTRSLQNICVHMTLYVCVTKDEMIVNKYPLSS